MLILNRRVAEAVMIFDDITVTVLSVKGSQVRLGFAADATVPTHREEIHERIQHERTLPGAMSHAATKGRGARTIASPSESEATS